MAQKQLKSAHRRARRCHVAPGCDGCGPFAAVGRRATRAAGGAGELQDLRGAGDRAGRARQADGLTQKQLMTRALAAGLPVDPLDLEDRTPRRRSRRAA